MIVITQYKLSLEILNFMETIILMGVTLGSMD